LPGAPTSRENPWYAYEKRAPALRWYGTHQMVNPALDRLSFAPEAVIQFLCAC